MGTLSVADCALLAQIVPVFLVVVIAERALSRRGGTLLEQLRRFLPNAYDPLGVPAMLLAEVFLVIGATTDGLGSLASGIVWVLLGVALSVIVLRWSLRFPLVVNLFLRLWFWSMRGAIRTLPKKARADTTAIITRWERALREDDHAGRAVRRTVRPIRPRARPSRVLTGRRGVSRLTRRAKKKRRR